MATVLVVDGANVVGSRPDGWWKDRPGAARRLHEQLLVADTPYDVVVLVLEGAAKGGVRAGRDGHVRAVHAKGSGDEEIVADYAAEHRKHERRFAISFKTVKCSRLICIPHHHRFIFVAADLAVALPQIINIKRFPGRIGGGKNV